MRKSAAEGATVELHRQGSTTEVVLDAASSMGEYTSGAQGTLTVIGPDLSKAEQTFTAVAPGRYRATFSAADRGGYHLQLSLRQGESTVVQKSRGVAVGYPEELRLAPTNETLLRRIAETTGGLYNPSPEQLFAPDDRIAHRAEPLWPWLLIFASILFLIDVASRRIDLLVDRPVSK